MLSLSGYHFSESTVEAMFTMADLDGDGLIQPHEAVPYMRAVIIDAGYSAAGPAPMPKLADLSPVWLDLDFLI